MAVMKMVALTMVGPREEMEPVARRMVLSGEFQPLPLDFLINDRNLRSRITTEINNPYDELLAKMSMVWKASGEKIPDPKPIPLDSGFSYHNALRLVENAANKLETWAKRRNTLARELERLEATKVYVAALSALGMKLQELSETRFALAYFGLLSADNFTRLEETTLDAPLMAVELSRSGDNVWILVFTVPGYKESAGKILDAVYFREYSLAEITSSLPRENPMEKIEYGMEFRKRSIKELESAAMNILNENREEFEKLYSKIYVMQRVYDLCKGRGELCGMYVLSGWIPEDAYEGIKDSIEKDAPRTAITVEEVDNISASGARIPTMLRNNGIVRAFQDIVGLYSVPSYGEVDPSPFVAITFILFFGFMFGDVGHGALLWLASAWLERRRIFGKSIARVMKYASCSSIVFGLLFGSYMGIEFERYALWISPIHDIGALFAVAIMLGVMMISAGMILNMIIRYRERDFARLLFDGRGLAGLFVYWGSAIAIYISIFGIKTPFPVTYLWYAIAAALMLTLFRDTLARTLLHRNVDSESGALQVFEVFHNLMNFFTNTASFVRLAAFALNHFALSFAVIILSRMMGNLPGGFILKALMYIAGTIFIVGLEGLIVFIQVLRLEYYEFFGKFYQGGGYAFKPVTWRKESAPRKS